jgi:transposase
VRNYRPFAPFDEVVEKKLKEAYRCCDNGHGNAEKWLIKKWGEKETERLFFIEAAYNQIETSYECRDCIILSTEEYYEKIHERLYSKKDN